MRPKQLAVLWLQNDNASSNPVMTKISTASLSLFEWLLGSIDRATVRLGRERPQPLHLLIGIRGEEAAFFHLRSLGYVIIARSWRSHRYAGDIDLIGWDGDCICFVEVKTRTTRAVATAESAVDEHKRKTLRKMARHYLRQLPEPAAMRFDVLSIYFERGEQPDFLLLRSSFGWSEPSRESRAWRIY